MEILIALQRFRFVWLNLLFVAYLWWLQPVVIQHLADSTPGAPDWALGSLLLGIHGLEVIGLLLKRPVGAFYARHYPDTSPVGSWRDNMKVVLLVFTPIFHLSLAAMLALVAFERLQMGIGTGSGAALQCLAVVLFFAVLTKEAVFATLLLGTALAGSAREQAMAPSDAPPWAQRLNKWLNPPLLPSITATDMLKDMAGDLLLLAFTALAYTATWETIAGASHDPGDGDIFAYIGLSIFFLMIYFTNRAVYLMQALSVRQNRMAGLLSWASFLVTWLTALWALSKP
ncbi:MAG: hypothetical protein ACOYYS_15960 [Chloroflexota bacterium]